MANGEKSESDGDDEEGDGDDEEGDSDSEDAEEEAEEEPTGPATADAPMEKGLVLEKSDDNAADGDFVSLARKHNTIYAIADRDDAQGWVASATIEETAIKDLVRMIPTVKTSETSHPSCLVISPEKLYLVVSQMGSEGAEADSKLLFYGLDGKILNQFDVPLADMIAFAYSPQLQHLFALDFSTADPENGGLYKVIGDGDGCRVKLITKLDRPTSMVFDETGNLYVTTLGPPTDDSESPAGQLLRIRGLDDRIPVKTDD